ncbi:MAG: HlyD family efflux transporter periplasmic adaptor subunit [Bacillota bacterium]|nr:HlyD family efflux transporter periplasmic adaptor subunit [Bacillota bacterium]
MEEQEKNKRKGKNRKLKIGSFIVALFLIVYIPSLFHWMGGSSIHTDLIRMGTIEDSINVDGIVVRNEEVLISPFNGKCIREAEEGEKVPYNFGVATILNDSSEKILSNIKTLDLRITQALKERNKNQNFFSDDIKKLDSDIDKDVTSIIGSSNNDDMSGIKQYTDDINSLIQKKTQIMGNGGTPDAFLNSLYQQKKNLNDQLKQNTREIISKYPGIISYSTDGNEAVLNPEAISQLAVKTINSIKAGKPVKNANIIVQAGKPFAKIIKDFEYHMVFVLDAQDAGSFKIGDSVKVRMNDIAQVVSASVEYKSNEESGKCILSVSTDQYTNQISGLRRINADLIKSSYSGLEVPVSSLKNIDLSNGKADIFVLDANYATLKQVKITGKNKENAIIENFEGQKEDSIALYDTYIVNPTNIKEGQMINQ